MQCLACWSTEFIILGQLGQLTWYRCRDCGMDQYVRTQPDD